MIRSRTINTWSTACRGKAPSLSGCESRPATVVPAGSKVRSHFSSLFHMLRGNIGAAERTELLVSFAGVPAATLDNVASEAQ